MAKSAFKIVATLFALGVIGVALLFAVLWHEHKTGVVLPKPTGQFAVGRMIYAWVNRRETDPLAASPEAKREVIVWIWYPAANNGDAKPASYLPSVWRSALAQHSGVLMSDFFTRDLALVSAHSTSGPNVSPAQPSYPVVIMRAGSGALTAFYTTLAEDLASHGYFVVGFDAPYLTTVVVLADGRVITRPPQDDIDSLPPPLAEHLANRLLTIWDEDIQFVVSQLQNLNTDDPTSKFTGRLDLEHLGIMGHSFGGAQALQFCHDDARCKAGINLDGAPIGSVIQDGLQQPFMFILEDISKVHAAPDKQIIAHMRSIYDRLPHGGYFVSLRGANHFTFSDQMLIKCPLLVELMRLAGLGRLDGQRGLAITAAYVHTFFDVYLKGEPRSQLAAISARYPEANFQKH
ncbi:MAG: alpha/beta hydrolase family protein [Candidatus Acidiferrales bacterium]